MPRTRAERSRRIAALSVAAGADVLQIALAPFFGEGFASPLNDALDLAVAGVLVWLLGFHWPLLPAVATEMIPGLDLAPTWTASVLLIVAPPKWRLWVAIGAAVLLGLVIYGVYRAAR